jgi:4-hydroxy-tetrahydrodipicolinate synthase
MVSFSGIWVPLVTPFRADGSGRGAVDHMALRGLVERCVVAGVSGLVALGTTGEPSSLDDDEQDAVLATIFDAAAGRLPVIVGLAGNNASAMLPRLRAWAHLDVAGWLVPAPYYVRPSQAGILDHFQRLAGASAAPLVVYDIPQRTGIRIEIETLLALAAHPNIVAVKDCSGSLPTTLALIRDGRLQVLAGNDLEMFATMCAGGAGAIAAAAHLRPADFVRVHAAIAEGRLLDARQGFQALVPLIEAMFDEPNPAPVKAALARIGVIDDVLRAPMTRASPALQTRIAQLSL